MCELIFAATIFELPRRGPASRLLKLKEHKDLICDNPLIEISDHEIFQDRLVQVLLQHPVTSIPQPRKLNLITDHDLPAFYVCELIFAPTGAEDQPAEAARRNERAPAFTAGPSSRPLKLKELKDLICVNPLIEISGHEIFQDRLFQVLLH